MADFEKRRGDLDATGIRIVGGSTDTKEDAVKTVQRHGITFPVAFGIDAEAFAHATGAFFEAERGVVHATGFLLRPDGTVGAAVYSTGPIGRFTPDEVKGMVEYWKKQ